MHGVMRLSSQVTVTWRHFDRHVVLSNCRNFTLFVCGESISMNINHLCFMPGIGKLLTIIR